MPIKAAATNDLVNFDSVNESFLVFYSSRDADGKLWCPDCVLVEGIVQDVFGSDEGPSALVFYVGQKSEWNTPSNIYRREPWNITKIPTVIKTRDGNEVARIVEDEIRQGLKDFVQSHLP